ncbi:MAG: methionine--tRNA ligase [Candidatus Pacebacteria bacterium]|nr:methionine--tRNA ligase [Candidatus Paceibacterota bacterium]
MENKNYYITTTLPYVNAKPHIGFALEIIQADVLARWRRSLGEGVFFNTGTDEHGLKIFQRAQELGVTAQQYCDDSARPFLALKDKLCLSFDNFIRTTDEHHIKSAQEFWKRCDAHGDIYKKVYKAKYCVGCELEVTDSQLVNGRCPIHPNKDVEIIEEENYFFRFSRYQAALLDLYGTAPEFVVPVGRLNEIRNFVKAGLQDFSISRVKEKMPWGIPVPGDESQVMYVWFDALVNYISCLGWPEDEKQFAEFWGTPETRNAVQVAGKDNLRQQSAMWQAMLLSAGLPNSKQVFIHGFVLANGQKMSKSLGNVIDPVELVDKYGVDAVRYFMLRELPSAEDGDFSYAKFEERYNADLAKGIGNLAARVTTVAKKVGVSACEISLDPDMKSKIDEASSIREAALANYRFNEALAGIWDLIGFCDRYIEVKQPWKTGDKAALANLLAALAEIAGLVEPFIPQTSEKIKRLLVGENVGILFPRLDAEKNN